MAGRDMYNTIVISPEPRGGRFLGGIIEGTPKPGTVMQIKSATEKVGGKFTWEVYNRDADSNRPKGPLAVLTEDSLQGRGITDAYVTGTWGMLYVPTFGDELLMLVQNVSGTDTFAIGDILIVDDGTGTLVLTTGSPEIEPFMCAETVAATAWTADTHLHCFFTGF
jgi:hypothetical protein